MIETKSMKVATSQEQEVIDAMADFGWELKSSQEINVKESHMESRGGDLYNVTTSENYVKVVFSRDTNMQNYAELKKLEATYFNIMSSRPADLSIKTAFILLCMLIFPGVLYIMNKSKAKKAWEDQVTNTALPAREKARSLLG